MKKQILLAITAFVMVGSVAHAAKPREVTNLGRDVNQGKLGQATDMPGCKFGNKNSSGDFTEPSKHQVEMAAIKPKAPSKGSTQIQ